MAKEVPIAEKSLLTPEEAAAYFNIGVNKIRMMTDSPSCPYVLWCGNRRLIKRKMFEEYLSMFSTFPVLGMSALDHLTSLTSILTSERVHKTARKCQDLSFFKFDANTICKVLYGKCKDMPTLF